MPDCLGSSLGLTTYRPVTLGKALHALAFWFSLMHRGDNFSTPPPWDSGGSEATWEVSTAKNRVWHTGIVTTAVIISFSQRKNQ